jgi:hypothetical protein
MAEIHRRIAKALKHSATKTARVNLQLFYGVYTGPDADANLSLVTFEGNALSGVPKLKHVTLTEGDFVMMIKGGGMPLTIIGVHDGLITGGEDATYVYT